MKTSIKSSSAELTKVMKTFWENQVYTISEEKADKLIPYLGEEGPITRTFYYGESQTTVAHEFLQFCSVAQLKKQEDFFKAQKDNLFYQQLLFTLDKEEGAFKMYDKLKLFLEWGYSPNLILNQQYHTYSNYSWQNTIEQATLLHILKPPRICELLMSFGASTTSTCRVYPDYEKVVAQGVGYIRSYQDYQIVRNTVPHAERNWYDLKPDEVPARAIPYETLNAHNVRLRICGKDYTPYGLAVALGHRPKFLVLKKYESNDNLETSQKESFEKLLDYRKSYPGRKQTAVKKLFQLLKEKNDYAVAHLEEVKKSITPELVFKLIYDNNIEAVKKIIENAWVEKGATHTGMGLMSYAVKYNKTQVFKILDENGYNDEIEAVFNRLNALLSRDEYKNLDKKNAKKKFTGMPNGIIYYLVDKKYSFHNQVLLKHVIDIEKEKIEKLLAAAPATPHTPPRPKMKI